MTDDNILASNLSQLGGQIASTYQNIALQNQYRNALPVMQQAFQSAMQDFDSGRSGAGFSKIMAVAMENPNNPYIQNITQMAFTAGKVASDDYLSRRRITDRTTSGLTEDELAAFNEFGLPGVGGGAGAGAGTDTELEGALYPEGTVSNSDGSVTLPDGRTIPAVLLTDALPTRKDYSQPVAEVDGAYQLQTGEQIVETPFLQELGIDIGAVVGPKKYSASIPKGTTESMTAGRKGLTATKSQQTEVVEKNTEEEKEFNSLIDKARSATTAIKSNAQLKKIFSKAGNDFSNIETDEEEDEAGKTIYKAFVTASDGTQSEEVLSKSEYDSLKVFTDEIPSFSSRTGVKIIKARKEQAAPAEPAAGGLPAVQAQAPPPAAPEIPEEAAGLQQIVTQGQAAKAGEQAKATENRIKAIDAEIKRLSSPKTEVYGYQPPGGFASAPRSARQKTPEEAQADIQKITKLKAEKELIVAKSEGRVFNTVEEAKASKKKFPSGTTIYIGGKPAKVK